MPVMDEFKEERAALKNGSPKQKFQYFLDYYKWHVIVAVIVITAVSTFIYQAVTKKDVYFCACFLNSAQIDFGNDTPDSLVGFSDTLDFDHKKNEIQFDSSVQVDMGMGEDIQAAQKLMVFIASAEYDVMVSDVDSLVKYGYQKSFYDLRNYLTVEQYEAYKDSFYYIDGAVANSIANGEYDITFKLDTLYKDPLKPEEMEDPVPVGVLLPANSPILKDYLFKTDDVAVSVMINTTRPEIASKFLDYFLQ